MRAKPMVWSLFLFLLLTSPNFGQSHRLPPSPKGDPTETPVDTDESRDRIASDMAKKANLERQAALKKAEEIEKLAHSVKEKMKGPN